MNFVRRAIRSLIRESRIKEAINKETLDKEALGKEALGKEAATKEAGATETGTKEAGTKETGTKETGTKETGTKETGTKETGTKETVSKETVRRERAAKETEDEFYALLGSAKPQLVPDPIATPWCAVYFIESKFPDGSTEQGSGFLISPKMMLTAAHNLCGLHAKTKKGMAANQISVYLSNTPGSRPITATRFVYDKRFLDNLERRLNSRSNEKTNSSERQVNAVEFEDPSYYDYGAIFLDEELTPKLGFFFGVCGTEPDDPHWDKPLTTAGYPNDDRLHYARGAAHPNAKDRFMGSKSSLVVHRAVTLRGESGGPLFLQGAEGEYLAVGIQVRQNDGEIKGGSEKKTSGAVRITRDMQKAFEAWEQESRKTSSQFGKGKHDVDMDIQNFIA